MALAMTLEGRTALVTGASRGLGRAIALRLARSGAAVRVNYREQAEAADAVVREIRAHGGRALAVRADVTDAAQVHDLVTRVTSELGDVEVSRIRIRHRPGPHGGRRPHGLHRASMKEMVGAVSMKGATP